MRQAISTKYRPATNTKGARIKAAGSLAGSLVDHWDHGANVEENHCRVAKLLAASKGWTGLYVGGGTKEGFVFVWAGEYGERCYAKGLEGRDWFAIASREA